MQTTAVQVHQHHLNQNNTTSQPTNPTTMYRFNNQPRDSGIFVGKESFLELGSGGGGICENDQGLPHHPDSLDSDEIILSPVNLQQSSGGGGGSTISTTNTNASSSPNNRYGASPLLNKKNTNNSSPKIVQSANMKPLPTPNPSNDGGRNRFLQAKSLFESNGFPMMMINKDKINKARHSYDNIEDGGSGNKGQQQQGIMNSSSRFLYCEKSTDSGISSPIPPIIRNEYRS